MNNCASAQKSVSVYGVQSAK